MVPEKAPLIIMDIKLAICMSNNVKDAKHTIHISRRTHFLTNGDQLILHNTVLWEGCLQLADIVTKNVREDELIPILGYTLLRLNNWHKTCQIGVTGFRRVWITMCY